MRLGALLGPIADPNRPRELAEQSRRYVGEGFQNLWTAQAVGRGFMMTDPLVALTIAATVTEDVDLGTAVLQVPLYPPMDLAHRVYSLQQISGNRLILGVGAGSTPADFEALGRDYTTRFDDFTSSIEDLRTIFQTGSLRDSGLSPWAAVEGGPPLFLGSWGHGVERAAAEFDGWIASAHYRTPDEIVAALRRYRAAGGGRAIVSTIQLSAGTDLAELKAMLDQFSDAGFDDAVVMFLPGGPQPAAVRKLL